MKTDDSDDLHIFS